MDEKFLKAIDDEPEFPGEMPDKMYQLMQGDKDACAECLRIVVRQTKEGIKQRYLQNQPNEENN